MYCSLVKEGAEGGQALNDGQAYCFARQRFAPQKPPNLYAVPRISPAASTTRILCSDGPGCDRTHSATKARETD
jgi:hypothetical protein